MSEAAADNTVHSFAVQKLGSPSLGAVDRHLSIGSVFSHMMTVCLNAVCVFSPPFSGLQPQTRSL